MLQDQSSFQALQASISQSMACHTQLLGAALAQLGRSSSTLAEITLHIAGALQSGRKLLIAGNGGSAAEAQHFAAELVGRFQQERAAYAAIALTADTVLLTALANDYGYQQVFVRQINAIGQPGDLLILFSTSGESENLVQAALAGREQAINVIAIVSERTCRLEQVASLTLRVPMVDTALTQELHMVIIHLLCETIEKHLTKNSPLSNLGVLEQTHLHSHSDVSNLQ